MAYLITYQEYAVAKDEAEVGNPEYSIEDGSFDDLINRYAEEGEYGHEAWAEFLQPLNNGSESVETWTDCDGCPTDERPIQEDGYVITAGKYTIEIATEKNLKEAQEELKDRLSIVQDDLKCVAEALESL